MGPSGDGWREGGRRGGGWVELTGSKPGSSTSSGGQFSTLSLKRGLPSPASANFCRNCSLCHLFLYIVEMVGRAGGIKKCLCKDKHKFISVVHRVQRLYGTTFCKEMFWHNNLQRALSWTNLQRSWSSAKICKQIWTTIANIIDLVWQVAILKIVNTDALLIYRVSQNKVNNKIFTLDPFWYFGQLFRTHYTDLDPFGHFGQFGFF